VERGDTIGQLQQQLPSAAPQQRTALEVRIRRIEYRITAEKNATDRYRWIQPYVERYLPSNPFLTLVVIVVGMLVGTLLKDVFLIANSILVARLAELTTFDLRKLFYRRTLRLDLATFNDEGTSELMSRFTHDMNNVSSGVMAMFGKLVREPLKAAACLLVASCICWRLLLLSLIIAPPALLLVRWLAKMLKRANRRAMEEMVQIYNTLDETFRGIKIVKAFTMERQERWRFHRNSTKYFHKAMKIARYDSLTHPMTEVMGILTICLALLAGVWLVLQGDTYLLGIRMCDRPLSLTDLMIFYGMLAGVADPMRKLSEVLTRIQQGAAASDRIFALLDREPRICDPQRPRPLPRHHRDLVLEHVDFSYQPDKAVLLDLNLLRRDDRHRGPQRLRQEHLGRPDSPLCRSHVGRDPAGRDRLARGADPRSPQPDRPGHAGDGAVRRHGLQQHPLRRAARHPGPGVRGLATGLRPPIHRRAARGGLRHDRGPTRRPALGRAAAADRPGPGDLARPGHHHPRRGHQPGRPGERAAHPEGVGAVYP
jgi:ATP-binding cassette subfamily B protein/subfamily B ATP-binding cassette protein MsbA